MGGRVGMWVFSWWAQGSTQQRAFSLPVCRRIWEPHLNSSFPSCHSPTQPPAHPAAGLLPGADVEVRDCQRANHLQVGVDRALWVPVVG